MRFAIEREDSPFIETDNLLYHYTSRATALEHILPRQQLRPGLVKDSNDPTESMAFGLELKRDRRQPTDSHVAFNMKDWFESTRVICLTADGPALGVADGSYADVSRRGWARDRMWAQYAEKHRGICILFDRKKLENAFRAAFTESAITWCGPVTYSDDPTALDARAIDPDLYSGGPSAKVRAYARKQIAAICAVKRCDWQSEREHRLVVVQNPLISEPEFVDVAEAIHGMVVGHAFNDVYAPVVRDVCDSLHVPAFRLRYRPAPEVLLYYPGKDADFMHRPWQDYWMFSKLAERGRQRSASKRQGRFRQQG